MQSSPTNAPVKGSNYLILENPATDSDYVMVGKPAAGKWLFTPSGTATLGSIAQSTLLPPPHVTASVSGKGRKRVLHYRVTTEPGQSVRFSEVAGKLGATITTTTKADGSVKFTPTAGPGGRREIVAQVLEGETVRKQLNVASYVAPPPPTPAKPTKLKLSRHGSSLSVSWRRASLAQRYLVTVRETDGADRQQLVTATHLTIHGLISFAGATVTVVGRTLTGLQGRAAIARLAATAAPKLRKAPKITGTAKVGKTLKCSTGTWKGHPTRYVTEWLRDGITIARATRGTLRLSGSVKGAKVACEVTARNAAGYASGTSHAVKVK